MFDGGKKNALPLFQKADEKFKKFVPISRFLQNEEIKVIRNC